MQVYEKIQLIATRFCTTYHCTTALAAPSPLRPTANKSLDTVELAREDAHEIGCIRLIFELPMSGPPPDVGADLPAVTYGAGRWLEQLSTSSALALQPTADVQAAESLAAYPSDPPRDVDILNVELTICTDRVSETRSQSQEAKSSTDAKSAREDREGGVGNSRWWLWRWVVALLKVCWGSGIICSLASTLTYSFNSVFVKQLQTMSPFQIVLVRGLVSMIPTVGLMAATGQLHLYNERRSIPFLFLRGAAGAVAVVLMYIALHGTSIANVETLAQPGAIMALAGWMILGERLSWIQGVGIVAYTAGVVLVTQPTFIFGSLGADLSSTVIIAMGLSICTNFLGTAAYLSTRYLGGRESALVTTFWFQALSILVSIPFWISRYPEVQA
eukprot:CAMPEP_0117656458 /NCGR_PEP_ID=MMETSP0804-20121206/4815_1 /TAXON_ID=1074897 /ORGANISM="Tetraselmis astigmatica, Strain CCMP880" /LENGTH=386 /DNA_ID=CAMNT_0005462861 /DNA_START=55 /DNA_END=1214 /DNA_ORIENTATION=+